MMTFTLLTATCAPMGLNNIDTDQIIPARFLKGTSKVGLGAKAFYDLRYAEDGSPKPDFVLNQPAFQTAQILVAPHNFGCGSSREHAPWAIKDLGIRALIAISFADIFKNNSLKNGLLPVALPEPVVLKLLEDIAQDPSLQVTIDLPSQTVQLPGQPEQSFEIDPYRKTCLIQGLDDIGYTLSHLTEIETFEKQHRQYPVHPAPAVKSPQESCS